MTTPLEREILTHYWVSPEPFPRTSQFIVSLHQRFIRMGLLKKLDTENEYGSWVTGNFKALEPYMAALANVPLPVQSWTVP